MPAFRYTASKVGSEAAVIDAPDRASALRLLRQRGITPASVEPIADSQARSGRGSGKPSGGASQSGASASSTKPSGFEFNSGRTQPEVSSAGAAAGPSRGSMSRAELAMFVRDLATATQSGLPLVVGMKTIIRSRTSVRQKALIERLMHSVEHGRSLADAAKDIGKPFNELSINLFRAGEVSGKLSEVMNQAAVLLERDIKMRRQLLGGLLYPTFLAVLIIAAICIIVGYVVPTIMAPLAGRMDPSKLPGPTKLLLWIAAIVKGYWWVMLGAVCVGTLTFSQAYRAPASRLSIDRFLLRVPVVGRVFRDLAVARFTRTLGTLLGAGLPALQALKITKGTLGNKAMEAVVDEVCEEVSAGKTISEPMERSSAFPPLLTQIISMGERSGRLPQMVLQAATTFEERVEGSLRLLVAVIPPALVLVAALVIALVMAAVLLMLLQMQELMG